MPRLKRGSKLCPGKSFSSGEHRGLDGEARSTDAAALLEDLAARGCLCPGQEAVRSSAFLLFRLIRSFRGHDVMELGCTHDTNSFSTKRQCARDSE